MLFYSVTPIIGDILSLPCKKPLKYSYVNVLILTIFAFSFVQVFYLAFPDLTKSFFNIQLRRSSVFSYILLLRNIISVLKVFQIFQRFTFFFKRFFRYLFDAKIEKLQLDKTLTKIDKMSITFEFSVMNNIQILWLKSIQNKKKSNLSLNWS